MRDQIGLPTSLLEVALEELHGDDSHEYPFLSDSVKYNDWLYNRQISNPYDNGEYSQDYSWNTTFVTWCADQLGYIDYNHVPKTSDSGELYDYLTSYSKNKVISVSEALSVMNPVIVVPGDLFFIPAASGGFIVGVVSDLNTSERTVQCIFGDVECAVEEMSVDLTQISSGSRFVRIHVEDPEVTAVAHFLVKELEITPAAACGVLSNISTESGFNPYALGDGGTSFGICQWHNERWDDLVDFCDSNDFRWQAFDSQLHFLKYELISEYPDLLDILRYNNNDKESAYTAGYSFCTLFERPNMADIQASGRGMNAKNSFYDKLFRAYQDDTILLDEFLLLDEDIEELLETEERDFLLMPQQHP